jgi:catechol 2,3-dioxygenase-like lactoylglutathione lyase family enzyme
VAADKEPMQDSALFDDCAALLPKVSDIFRERGLRLSLRPWADAGSWGQAHPGGVALVALQCDQAPTAIGRLRTHGVVTVGVVDGDGNGAGAYRSAFRFGVTACFHRSASSDRIQRVIDAVADGEVVLPLPVLRSLATTSRGSPGIALSTGDRTILRHIGRGGTVPALAELLHRSERDCYRVLRELYGRLGVSGRAEAIARAADLGLLEVEKPTERTGPLDVPTDAEQPASAIPHVTLLVRDYDKAIRFYVEAVGFTLREDVELGDGRRWVVVGPEDGGTGLLLIKASTPEQEARVGDQTAGRVALLVETADLQSTYEKMLSAGVHFLEEPRHELYATVAVWRDLYGNRLGLFQPR